MVKNSSAMWETWVRKVPWRRAWNPIQYPCLENSQGQRSLVGYNPWGHKELDMTERLSTAQLYTYHSSLHIFIYHIKYALLMSKDLCYHSLEEMDNRKRGPRNQFWLKSFLAPLKWLAILCLKYCKRTKWNINIIYKCVCVYIYIYIYTPYLLYTFIYWLTFRLLPALGYCIINNASMNTGYMYLFKLVSPGISRCGIAGSYGNPIFSILRN